MRLGMTLLFLALLCAGLPALGGEAPKPQAFALLAAGESGNAFCAQNYKDWIVRLHKVVTECGVPAANVRVLMERKESAPGVNECSQKDKLLAAFKELAARMKPGDQFFLAFIGHGTLQNKVGKFCLPGPHLSGAELAQALYSLPAREVIFVDATSSGGAFLEPASAPGRVVITATNTPLEGNETYFMEFFLQGFENKAADANKDGVVDMLEAFNYAASNCAKWYLRQYYFKEKHALLGTWRIEGKQSRALWQKFYGQNPEKIMVPPLDAEAADAEPLLGEWGDQWVGRRMVSEHAQLDDTGTQQGLAIFDNAAFSPLTGTAEGGQGKLAKMTVLGKPRGDTAPPALPPVSEDSKAQP